MNIKEKQFIKIPKKFKFRMTNPDKVERRKKEGWQRGCSDNEKETFGNKQYMGTDNVLMKKEVV